MDISFNFRWGIRMTVHEAPSEQSDPKSILSACDRKSYNNVDYINHPIVQQFGTPNKDIYIDNHNVEVGHIKYEKPLVLPLYNEQLELIQCAVLQVDKRVSIIKEGIAKGFAYYGELRKDQPVIITYDLEAFFKIAQTSYAVVLVILPTLCTDPLKIINTSDIKQIKSIIDGLLQAGYSHLYLPFRPGTEAEFGLLNGIDGLQLINQYQGGSFCDLSQYDESEQVAIFIELAIKQSLSHCEWKDLAPLVVNDTSVISTYPIYVFPKMIRNAIEAAARYVQVPISMAAQAFIGTMSHIAQQFVNAPDMGDEQGQPCSLFLLTEGQSGSRKSTIKKLADREILKYERIKHQKYSEELKQSNNQLIGLNKKEKAEYVEKHPLPQNLVSLFTDVTLESISGLYIDGVLSNASISSDEAGQFFGGYSMKSDMRSQVLGTYTKLFDTGSIERTRSKSNLNGSGQAFDVRLTFNLQGQHEVLSSALNDPILRGQGFLPRFLFVAPENLAGTRLQNENSYEHKTYEDEYLKAFWGRCDELLSNESKQFKRIVLTMSVEAKQVDLDFYNEIEQLQGKNQIYEYLQAFASRASQQARRLSTILAFFDGKNEIGVEYMRAACAVVRYSLSEWLKYTSIEPRKESDAQRLIKWLITKCNDQKVKCLDYSYIQTSCPRPMQKRGKLLEMIIHQLEDSNYLKVIFEGKKRIVVLNPILFSKMTK